MKWLVLLCFCFFCFSNVLLALELRPISDQEVDEGQMLKIPTEAVSDEPPVHFAILNPLPGMDLQNVRQVSQDHFACDFVWTPDFDQAGDCEITITAEDKGDKAAETFKVKVNDVNRPPGEPTDPHPTNGESVCYDDKLVLSWNAEKYDADGDKVEFLLEIWQKESGNKIVSTLTEELSYEIAVLKAGDYEWQVRAIDEHNAETKGAIWKFTVEQWSKVNIDATVFVLLVRKPGEYTLKWTNIKVQSNGDLGLNFNPIDAEGPNGERIRILYGTKEAGGDIIWHNESWVMQIKLPQEGYSFELYAKVKIEPKHSSGLYQGKLKLNVVITQ